MFRNIPILRGLTEVEPYLKLALKHESLICGGYPRYCCSPRENPVKAGDVDFFPQTLEQQTALLEEFKALGFEVVHENHVSVTLEYKGEDTAWLIRPTPQIIKPMKEGKIVTYGTVEEILQNFDFTIVRCALVPVKMCDCGHAKSTHVTVTEPGEGFVADSDACMIEKCPCRYYNAEGIQWTAVADEKFLDDEKDMFLRIENIHCPVSSTLRCMKYARKGYFAGPGQIIRLFADWDQRPPEYRSKLFELFKTSQMGSMTRQEIDALEALLRID